VRVAIAVSGIALATACSRPGPQYDTNALKYVAETVGVVAAVHSDSHSYELVNGQHVTVENDEWLSNGSAQPSDLLLLGSAPQAWGYAIPAGVGAVPNGCFQILVAGAWVRDGSMDALMPNGNRQYPSDPLNVYFRFPLATNFAARYEANGDLIGRGWLCLNQIGQAIAYD